MFLLVVWRAACGQPTVWTTLNASGGGVRALLIALRRAAMVTITVYPPSGRTFRPKRGGVLGGRGEQSTLNARDQWSLFRGRWQRLTLPRARFRAEAECSRRDVQVFGVRRAIGECCDELQARELPDARQHKEGEHRFESVTVMKVFS